MSIILSGNTSTGIGKLTYQWLDSSNVVISTGITALVNSADTYTLIVTDDYNGNTNSESIILTGNLSTPMALIKYSTTVITNNSPIITLDGTHSSGNNPLTYQWTSTVGTGIITNPLLPTVNVISGGTYTLVVTDSISTCASNPDSVIITEGTSQSDSTPTAVIVGNNFINCNITQLELSGNTSIGNTLSYNWSASNGGNITSSNTNSTIFVNSGGTYTLMVTDGVNSLANQVNHVVTESILPPIIAINVSPDNTITHVGDIKTLSATTGLNYLWSTGETTQQINVTSGGTYSVTGTSTINGCSSNASQQILVNLVNLSIVASSNNGLVLDCGVQSLTLTGNISGNIVGVISYQWFNSNNVIVGNSKNLNITTPDTYRVAATDSGNNEVVNDTIIISNGFSATIPVSIITGNSIFSCTGSTVTLDGSSSTGSSPLLYEWSTLDGSFSSPNTGTTISALTTGTYSLRVYNNGNGGCTNTANFTISQSQSPTITLTLPTTNIVPSGGTLTIGSNASGGASPYAYQWSSLNNSIVGSTTGVSIEINSTDRYFVIVTDAQGCTGTTSTLFTVASNSDTQAPTIPQNNSVVLQTLNNVNSARIVWDASTDNVGVTHYDVFKEINPPNVFRVISTPTTTFYVDSTVNSGGDFCYKVQASDSAGNLSGFSNIACITISSGGGFN